MLPLPNNEPKISELSNDSKIKIDFSDTKVAFSAKSDQELKFTAWLFSLMNQPKLVKFGSKLMLLAINLRLPFVKGLVRRTIFQQFCGGRTLLEVQQAAQKLYEFGVLSILDYGVEAKQKEVDFNRTMNEVIRAIEFASHQPGIPTVSIKITGIARFGLLEKQQKDNYFTKESRKEYKNVLKRLDAICHSASEKGVTVFIDGEETWIQNPIDHLVTVMMRRYNRKKVVVYNTFQMYRADRLQFLIDSFNLAKKGKYILGAKLVRGAYMEKERQRAKEMGYPSPIHVDKRAADDAFNKGIQFCLDNHQEMTFCNASHNEESNRLQIERMISFKIPFNHPNIYFCQLYGMSDNLTFNLAETGCNVAKLIPYGPVKEVMPYLIRRAQENTAVTGDVSREYSMIKKELRRRGIK